jgi:hypothetical protein
MKSVDSYSVVVGAIAATAQRIPMAMIARSSRIPLLGGGMSSINIFLILKKRSIPDSVEHVLCQRVWLS